MPRLRGEEQDGFLDVLENWLVNQPWFPARTGRRRLARVGGMRFPLPEGVSDPQTTLELHILDVEHGAMLDRISVPVALRSRPSALAGKEAFIGRLTVGDGTERWLYDGAMDHAFLAAWLEAVRCDRGSRDGRSHARSFGDVAGRAAFTARLSRSAGRGADEAVTRTLVRPESAPESAPRPGDGQLIVDFFRRPVAAQSETLLRDTVLTLADRQTAFPRVLGLVTGAWMDRFAADDDLDAEAQAPSDAGGGAELADDGPTPEGAPTWEFGDLSLVREATAQAPDGISTAGLMLQSGESFAALSRRLGQALGGLHADLAAVFGAHPQSTDQLSRNLSALREKVETAENQCVAEGDEDLAEAARSLRDGLDGVFEPLALQRIHGSFGLERAHLADIEAPWVIDEGPAPADHAPTYQDTAAFVVSLARVVVDNAGQDVAAARQWFDESLEAFFAGYRDSDAEESGVDSARFRTEVFLRALPLLRDSVAGRVLSVQDLLRHSR